MANVLGSDPPSFNSCCIFLWPFFPWPQSNHAYSNAFFFPPSCSLQYFPSFIFVYCLMKGNCKVIILPPKNHPLKTGENLEVELGEIRRKQLFFPSILLVKMARISIFMLTLHSTRGPKKWVTHCKGLLPNGRDINSHFVIPDFNPVAFFYAKIFN